MTRRQLLKTFGGAAAASAPGSFAFAQIGRRYDILIKGGEVRDPSRGYRQVADVAVLDGRIAAIESDIPADRGIDVIDAKGLYVAPGLVDLHTHVHHGLRLGIEADPLAVRSGTTTWVDAGTFAHNEIKGFRRFIVNPAQARIYGLVYLSLSQQSGPLRGSSRVLPPSDGAHRRCRGRKRRHHPRREDPSRI